MRVKHRIAACALAGALFAPAAQAMLYSGVYSFGDSLSDTGNVLATTTGLGLAPVPPSPYFAGRYSNGPVAIEHVATGLGVPLVNFAYGGATSGTTNVDFLPTDPAELYDSGVQSQVARFAASLGAGGADAGALYVVSGGSNDFLAGDLSDPAALAASVIGNLIDSVSQLYSLGARNFLLPLLPDLGMAPEAAAVDPLGAAQLSALVADFDIQLAAAYAGLLAGLPDARGIVFNTYSAQRSLVADAANNGLTDATTPCFTGSETTPGTVCADPEHHVFWDREHPSARMHELLGQRLLGSLPEPGSAALAAAALLALAARRRPRPA